MTPEQEVIALRRRVRELEEELAEYQFQGARVMREILHNDDWVHYQRAFRISMSMARILQVLVDKPGVAITREGLRYGALGKAHTSDRLIDVHICRLRKALSQMGFNTAGLYCIPLMGYGMSKTLADAIRAFVNECR